MKNIFMENQKEITFEEYMAYKKEGRIWGITFL